MHLKNLFLFLPFIALSQEFPKDYFNKPLDIMLQLSGNFGELRSNHFHSGLDFKTQKKEGFNVFASAEGYISRIKISPYGYGKAIYINHPNGFTTVYGHLQSGSGDIEKFIKKEQYKSRSFELDIYLQPTDLPVKQDQIIGISGNTGGSDGPHLHFEIRDTKSEKIINPLFFGFDSDLPDTKPPFLSNLYVYPIGNYSVVNQSQVPIPLSLNLQDDGTYLAEKVIANGEIGFSVGANDFDNVSWNGNGIYKMESFLNGKSIYKYQFDSFSFDETRYVNALIDYQFYKKTRIRLQKLFRINPFDLSIITTTEHNGIIKVDNNRMYSYRVEVSDFNGNKTTVLIPIQFGNQTLKLEDEDRKQQFFVKSNNDNIYEKENVTISFPAHTFYEDFYMDFNVKNNELFLHKDVVAAHKSFAITFTLPNNKITEKTFIGLVDGKKITHYNTKIKENTLTCYTKTLGHYKIITDVDKPKIKISHRITDKWITKQKQLVFTINDETSGIKSYDGYLNDKWILFEYDPKTKKLYHDLNDGFVVEGKNTLKLYVNDNVGNSSIFETNFFSKQKP